MYTNIYSSSLTLLHNSNSKQERGKRLRSLKDESPQVFGDVVIDDLKEARCETGVSEGVDDELAVREGRVER